MSRTWREWGVERMERSLRKEHDNWKQEALKEFEVPDKDALYSVYVIINEWADESDQEDLSEIVDGKWFPTQDDAWDALKVIAESVGLTVEGDDTSFDVPNTKLLGLTHDTYYIQELTR